MKTFNEIVNDIINSINSIYNGVRRIDTRIGTVLRDVIISPFAYVISNIYTYLSDVQRYQNVYEVSGDRLELLASNWGIKRASATPSSGIVRLYRSSKPLVDISIPAGTIVYSSSLSFRIIESVVFSTSPLLETSNDSPYKGFYYVECHVVCDTPGTIGNIGVGEINKCSLTSIDHADNPSAFNNGKDEQSDESLREYIVSSASGGVGTEGGYRSLILKNYNVKDVQVISYNNSDAFLNKVNGTGNIFIYSNNNMVKTEFRVGERVIYFSRLPILEVYSVKKNGVLLSASDYVVSIDRVSMYRGSYRELSNVSISNTIPISSTDNIEVSYLYNEDVGNMQSFIDLPDNKIVGSEIYVKMALPIRIKIGFKMFILPGYDYATLRDSVISRINNYISNLKLGATIQKSDIVNVIYDINGVDSVDLDSFVFEKANDYFGNFYVTVDSLSILKSEYYLLDSINIT